MRWLLQGLSPATGKSLRKVKKSKYQMEQWKEERKGLERRNVRKRSFTQSTSMRANVASTLRTISSKLFSASKSQTSERTLTPSHFRSAHRSINSFAAFSASGRVEKSSAIELAPASTRVRQKSAEIDERGDVTTHTCACNRVSVERTGATRRRARHLACERDRLERSASSSTLHNIFGVRSQASGTAVATGITGQGGRRVCAVGEGLAGAGRGGEGVVGGGVRSEHRIVGSKAPGLV
jgi:hypothetical protein